MGGPDQTERPPRPPLLSRVSARQLQYLDFVLAGFFAAVALAMARGGNGNMAAPAFIAGVAIALRRRAPFTALSLVIVVIAVTTLKVDGNSIADPFVAFPMYQVASVRPRRESIPALAVALVCFTAALFAYHVGHGGGPGGDGNDSLALVVAVASWFVGDSVRTRRTYTAGLAEQAAQRQRETVETGPAFGGRGTAPDRPRTPRRGGPTA